jgi:hypothetical protein
MLTSFAKVRASIEARGSKVTGTFKFTPLDSTAQVHRQRHF